MAQRRTQEERSAETKTRLLDATIECLVERGYSGTTTTLIAERAGVSRGAQLHHYPTKDELVLAAVEHLGTQLDADLRQAAARLPADGDRVALAVELLWSRFSTPFFAAWLELWVAARTDAGLRVHMRDVEQRLMQGIERRTSAVFGEDALAQPGYGVAVRMTLSMMQGMALSRLLSGRKRPTDQERGMLEAWSRLFPLVLSGADAGTPV